MSPSIPTKNGTRKVTEIVFELVVDGVWKRWRWYRPDKIASLLVAEDATIGQWLRALRDIDHEGMATPAPEKISPK